jgi:hypothetical protein
MSFRILGRLMAGAALALVAFVGAHLPASADTNAGAPVSAVSYHDSTAPAGDFTVLSWRYYFTYDTRAECKDIGLSLVEEGLYSNYSCQYRNGRYELWVYGSGGLVRFSESSSSKLAA